MDWSEKDEYALNEACWKFVEVWDKNAFGPIGGALWNQLKPLLRETIKEYVAKKEGTQ